MKITMHHDAAGCTAPDVSGHGDRPPGSGGRLRLRHLVANLVPVSTVAVFQEEDMHDKNALQCRRNGQARMGVYTWPGLVGEEAPTKQESEHTRH